MMSRRLWLINLLLILMFLLLAGKVYDVLTRPQARGWIAGAPKQRLQGPASFGSGAGGKNIPSPNRFRSVSERNLFSPERKEFPSALTADGKKILTRPNIMLYGVAIGGGQRSAIVSNPEKRAAKEQRETMTVKIGDQVAGYKVAKILENRIVLERNEDAFDLLLYDPARPKSRPPVATLPRPAPTTPSTRAVPPASTVGQQPPLPVAPPPGMIQAPLTPPSGRELPRRTITRQRSDRRQIISPRSGVAVSPDKKEGVE